MKGNFNVRIAICDDNKKDILLLNKYVKACLDEKQVDYKLDCYISGNSLLLSNHYYDIVFLDIEMDEINGIQLGKLICEKNMLTRIIYVTSYNNYLKDAFQIHAFMYINKPISYSLIENTLKDCLKYFQEQSRKNMVTFSTEGNVINLDARIILYFEYTERKIKIVTNKNEYYFRGVLKSIYEEIKRFNFEMPHNAFLVNFLYIEKIKGYNIYLKNNVVIPISQKKIEQFKNDYYEFLHNVFHLIK